MNKLQYISQGNTSKEQLNNIKSALDAGCKWIQLRFKNAAINEIIKLGEDVKILCANHNATFIINDFPLIARQLNADGVHVGLGDLDVASARKIIGVDKIIGGTANTMEHILQRINEGCNYVGVGPFRFTKTKEKLSPIIGLDGYKTLIDELKNRSLSIPIYAIGGIGLNDVSAIMETGVFGVAISGEITLHPNKNLLIEQLNTALAWSN